MLIRIFMRKKHLLVKPSIWFIIFFHIQVQWSSTFYAEEIFEKLSSPYVFFFFTQILPIIFLISVQVFYKKEVKNINNIIGKFDYLANSAQLNRILKILVIFSAGIIVFYLINVPLSKTGLYAIWKGDDALAATQAREDSLKLTSAGVRYTYVFFNKFLALAIVVILAQRMFYYFKNKIRKKAFTQIFLIILTAMFASLSGARSHGAFVLLAAAIGVIFLLRFNVNFLRLFVVGLAMLFLPVYLQIHKFGKAITVDNVLAGYEEILLRRTLKIPMETGLSWVDYVEKNGYWGLRGVSFLSGLSGDTPVEVANFMMNRSPDANLSVDTGLMNTSFVFSYYCYIGPISILIIPLLVMGLDLSLKLIQRLNPCLVLPAVVTTSMSCINLVSTEYQSIFLSYGFLTGLVFYAILNKRLKRAKFKPVAAVVPQ